MYNEIHTVNGIAYHVREILPGRFDVREPRAPRRTVFFDDTHVARCESMTDAVEQAIAFALARA